MHGDDLPDLFSLRTLVRIADEGSLAAAGRTFGLSASAVGKTLTRLEARLSARLFHRSTRRIALTDEGTAVLARARRILAEAEALREDLSGRTAAPSGRLRLSLPLVGQPFLGLLAAFSLDHPAIELDISFSDRPVDVVGEGFDAAIRSGPVRDTRLMATALGSFRMGLAASPAYLAARGTPARVEHLVEHRCIGFRLSHSGKVGPWPTVERAGVALAYAVVCNDLEARLAFAVAGVGIAALPSFALDDHLRAGRLVRLLDEAEEVVPLTLLWPSRHHLAPKMRVFLTHMVERLRPLLA